MLKPLIAPVTTAVIALALLAGCFPDYFPRRKLKVNLSPVEMAGHWQLTADSADMLARHYVPVTKADSSIDLFADGGCELHKFVDEEDLFSGKATWKLEEGREDSSDRKISVLHIMVHTGERQGTALLYFTRKHRKLILWQYHSDPDGREYIEYERI